MIAAILLGCAPPLPASRLVTVDPARSLVAAHGVLVTAFYPAGDGFALIVGGDGRIAWSRAAPSGLRVARVTDGGGGTVVLGLNDPGDERLDGTVYRETLDGDVVSDTVVPSFHHDLVPLDGGRFAALGHTAEQRIVDGHGSLEVGSDVIRLADEGGGSTVAFDFLHDYGVDPFWTCPHMTRGEHVPGVNEWTHTNSLVRADDGGWLVMPRYLDAIVKLDPSFRVEWQLGGRDGDLDTDGAVLFAHAHFSDAWDDRILVFDNGWDHDGPPAAKVVELAVDAVAHTAREVWSYAEPEGRYVSYLGDAKRLSNGNTLIAWGNLDRIDEVTPEGDVVWQVALDRTVGRAELWTHAVP
ncbi:MAG: aryl-sulfate sulfotransferase [Myxococcota bacterium]